MESGWSPRIIRICRGVVLVAELRAGGGGWGYRLNSQMQELPFKLLLP